MDIKMVLEKIKYFLMAISFNVSAVVSGSATTTMLLVLWPFNKSLYRKLVSYLLYTMLAQPVFWLRYFATTNFKLYVDKEVYEKFLGKEHSLCILNHTSDLDWIVMTSLLDHLNILGYAKAYMKNAIKFIPFIGWGFYCCGSIFLTRSYEKDKIVLKKGVHDLCEYEEPITIFLYPEGTTFSLKKREEGLKFSRERRLKEMQHHLVPRTKGFTASVPLMKGKIPAVYDIEIAFDGIQPTYTNLFKGRRFNAHMYLRRIPMEQLPNTEKELDLYLREMFYRKDESMASFLKTSDFFKLTNQESLEPITIEPNVNSFYNMIFWHIISLSLIMFLLFNGQFLYVFIFITYIGLSFALFLKFVDHSVKVQESNRENDDKMNQF